MELNQIDRVELAEYLIRGEIREAWTMLGVRRYRVESDEPGEQIASVTVAVHGEIMTIEIMGLRTVT
jgi:hypothetical protein